MCLAFCNSMTGGFFMFSEDFDEVWDVDDDEVLECGLENPEYCESCQ